MSLVAHLLSPMSFRKTFKIWC